MSFYSSIAAYYDLLYPFDETQYRFLETVIDPACGECPGVRTGESALASRAYLDVGCGMGTLLSALSDRFHRLVGVDNDEALLALAAKKLLPGEGKKTELLDEDMCELKEVLKEDEFNLVTCMGNTLAHVTKPAKIVEFLSSVFDMLENDGAFVFQSINYDRILAAGIRALPTLTQADVTFERRYSLPGDDGTIIFETLLQDTRNDVEIRNAIPLFPITKEQLEGFLRAARFGRWTFYGDWAGTPWTPDSFLLIGVCG